jgi:hypothetical protein
VQRVALVALGVQVDPVSVGPGTACYVNRGIARFDAFSATCGTPQDNGLSSVDFTSCDYDESGDNFSIGSSSEELASSPGSIESKDMSAPMLFLILGC